MVLSPERVAIQERLGLQLPLLTSEPSTMSMHSMHSMHQNRVTWKFAGLEVLAWQVEKAVGKLQSRLAKETGQGKSAYPFKEPGRSRQAGRGDSEEYGLLSIACL